jgi:hypothetical protein
MWLHEYRQPFGCMSSVRDPALLRAARGTADGTAILMGGAPVGVP